MSPCHDGTVCPRVRATPKHPSLGISLNDLPTSKYASGMSFDICVNLVTSFSEFCSNFWTEPLL